MKTALYIALGIFGVGFVAFWAMSVMRDPQKRGSPGLVDYAIGLVFCFFDALGVGSYAPTTACFKTWRLVRDEDIPGTLNVGFSLTGILQALFYIAVVEVEPKTLTLMIAAAVLGAWLGGGVVSRWPRRRIQIGMGIALLITACFALLRQLNMFPGGGDLLGLDGAKLLVAVVISAILGSLKTIGFGFYAPCMMVTYLMGMNPRAAYPIMMGAIAFAGPVASVPFIQQKRYSFKAALGMTLGGLPAVLLAVFVVGNLPLNAIRWLVLVVMVYAAMMMLRSASAERARTSASLSESTAIPSGNPRSLSTGSGS